MVTAEDADVGENSRLTYRIEAGDATGMFTMWNDSGLVTWSALANDSLAACSWTLSIRVSDHGKVKQLWTLTSLGIVIDDCAVDNAASRQSAADLGRSLITDWHVFVVSVAIATCVVVVGSLLTAVVAVRHCSRRRRRRKTLRGDGVPISEEREGEIMLKLISCPSPSSETSSDSAVSNYRPTDHMLLVVDQLHANQDVSQSLIRALQQAHQQMHGPLQVISHRISLGRVSLLYSGIV